MVTLYLDSPPVDYELSVNQYQHCLILVSVDTHLSV